MKRKLAFFIIASLAASMIIGGCGKKEEEANVREEYQSPLETEGLDISDENEPQLVDPSPVTEASDGSIDVVSDVLPATDSGVEDSDEIEIEDIEEDVVDEPVDTSNKLNGTGEASYKVSRQEYENTKRVTINYPKITGWDNESDKQKWNKIFKKEAKLESKALGFKDSATMDYEVMQMNDTYLSIVMTVDESRDGAPHPNSYMYTYNINMTNGEKVKLKDIADTYDLAQILYTDEGYEISNEDLTIKDILDFQYAGMKYSKSRVAADLEYVDYSPKKVQKNGGNIFAQSYIDDGHVCLVFDVSHAMGDYVTVVFD